MPTSNNTESTYDWKKSVNYLLGLFVAALVAGLASQMTYWGRSAADKIIHLINLDGSIKVPDRIYTKWWRKTDAGRDQYLTVTPVNEKTFHIEESQENPHVDYTLRGDGQFYKSDSARVSVVRNYGDCTVPLYYLFKLTESGELLVYTRSIEKENIKQCELITAEMDKSGPLTFTLHP